MELTINNLTKTFQSTTAVDGLSYTMDTGVYGLLGVNGAGKTTLMRMLCTLLQPSSGSITWNGEDIFALGSRYRRLLGYLPQDFGYYPDFTIQDYLLYIASLKGLRPSQAKARTEELLHQVGLTKAKNKKMRKLSGGMKRRAGIAQAMLNDPRILILDEPTAGLDPKERIRFRNLISELSQDRLVLLSTHIVSDIESIAGDILLMKDGRLVCSGATEALTSSIPVRAWRCVVPKGEAAQYEQTFQVSNLRPVPQGMELRILAEGPPLPGGEEDPVTLEDVFLYHFGEQAGDDDAAI